MAFRSSDSPQASSRGSSTTLSLDNFNGRRHSVPEVDSFTSDLTNNDLLLQDEAESETDNVQYQYNEEEDDPLGVKKLALSFDYLVYQITEKVQSLALQTEETVKYKKQITEDQLFEVEESINKLNALLTSCKDLDNDFAKLEQISFIVSDFKQRIRQLEDYFKKH